MKSEMRNGQAAKGGKLYANPVFWGLVFGFVISLFTLILYLSDPDLPDSGLFTLLALIRYSSFFVCVCSVYLLIAGVWRLIRRPGAAAVLKIIVFLCAALYGAVIIVFTVFIAVIAAGNG